LFSEKVSLPLALRSHFFGSAINHEADSDDDANEESDEEFVSKRLRPNEDGDEEDDETDLRSQDDRES
jgi:hypothetical protein